MELLKKSTILYINQVRQDNFDKLIGKGFSEALSWKELFKRIIFVCYSSSGKYLYRRLYNNCYLIGIPFDLTASMFKSFLNIGYNYLRLLLFLLKLTKRIKIDLIRMENILLSGLSIFFLSIIRRIPYIVWLGGYEKKALYIKYGKNFFTWLLSKLIFLFEIIILKKANFVFPVTDDLFNLAKKRKVKNKILSPNYIDLSLFIKNQNKILNIAKKIRILYVGRFEEEKGIKILLKAIKNLSIDYKNYELIMVGDGSLKQWITNYVHDNNLENIKLLGKFSHDEMPNIYNSADIFVLPSYTEGSPASLIEALSCGIASIATNVGDSKKLIKNGVNGFLVPPGDSRKISEAIKKLIENKVLLEKFSKNSRASVIKYTKNYSKIHIFVYKQILKIFN